MQQEMIKYILIEQFTCYLIDPTLKASTLLVCLTLELVFGFEQTSCLHCSWLDPQWHYIILQ